MTLVLTAKYHVKPGKVPAVLDALRRMKAQIVEAEPGCLVYQVSRSSESENLLLLHEHYRDEAALEAHRQTAYFKQIIETEIVPWLENRIRERYTLEIA
jgi:quinol monooxygenase YgiN